jgi:hypothetical protein
MPDTPAFFLFKTVWFSGKAHLTLPSFKKYRHATKNIPAIGKKKKKQARIPRAYGQRVWS